MAPEPTPPSDDAAEDRALMRRAQAGDEAAFAALMRRWERPVKALIGRIVLNARDADELAQDAFVRLWQHRDRWRPDAAFRPWLLAIAVNLARNRLRWWRSRPEVALEAWTDAGEAEGAAEAAERAEQASAVQAAVAALPTDQRTVLVLAVYEQLSHAEIAALVGGTAKAVERRLARAREALRSRLPRGR